MATNIKQQSEAAQIGTLAMHETDATRRDKSADPANAGLSAIANAGRWLGDLEATRQPRRAKHLRDCSMKHWHTRGTRDRLCTRAGIRAYS